LIANGLKKKSDFLEILPESDHQKPPKVDTANNTGWLQELMAGVKEPGRNGKWQATFDWIINESNFVKILEGNFHK